MSFLDNPENNRKALVKVWFDHEDSIEPRIEMEVHATNARNDAGVWPLPL